MESELSELRTQTSALESEVSMLERRVARGEYNPETFQCLQLALNPSTQDLAIRTATLQALREENQALLGMLADKGVESVPKVSMDLLRKEKEEEKAQLEKRLLRLKEVRLLHFLLCQLVLTCLNRLVRCSKQSPKSLSTRCTPSSATESTSRPTATSG